VKNEDEGDGIQKHTASEGRDERTSEVMIWKQIPTVKHEG